MTIPCRASKCISFRYHPRYPILRWCCCPMFHPIPLLATRLLVLVWFEQHPMSQQHVDATPHLTGWNGRISQTAISPKARSSSSVVVVVMLCSVVLWLFVVVAVVVVDSVMLGIPYVIRLVEPWPRLLLEIHPRFSTGAHGGLSCPRGSCSISHLRSMHPPILPYQRQRHSFRAFADHPGHQKPSAPLTRRMTSNR